jgi:deoxyxylulose-5-phosphate synthase
MVLCSLLVFHSQDQHIVFVSSHSTYLFLLIDGTQLLFQQFRQQMQ